MTIAEQEHVDSSSWVRAASDRSRKTVVRRCRTRHDLGALRQLIVNGPVKALTRFCWRCKGRTIGKRRFDCCTKPFHHRLISLF